MSDIVSIETSRFGKVDIKKDSILSFPNGIIGFSEYNEFVVLEHKEPFSWLQSTSNPALAFVVVDSINFGETYKDKPSFENSGLELRNDDEFAILVLIAVNDDKVTVNLKAPILVNLTSKKAVQSIIDNDELSTSSNLWDLLP